MVQNSIVMRVDVSIVCKLLLGVLFSLWMTIDGSEAETGARTNRKLILVSLDGFRWDYLNGRAKTPNLDAIRKQGVFATKGLQNEYITNTLPNHMTLVTGLHVESHGIVDNFMYDPDMKEGFIPKYKNKDYVNKPDWHANAGEPIWVTNQLQGAGHSGVIMWMGAEAAIKGVRPTFHVKHDPAVTFQERVDKLITMLAGDLGQEVNLGLIHFPEPDLKAHAHGPDSPEVTKEIENMDGVVGELFRQLREKKLTSSTDVIITADHGFVSVSKEKMVVLDELVDPSLYRHGAYIPGPVGALWPHEGQEDAIYNALQAASRQGTPITVYRKSEIPKRFHYAGNKRVPPIFVAADTGYTIIDKAENIDKFPYNGNHGYDNSLQDMHPFFLAVGSSFKEDFEVNTFRSVDVYPLMCHILGLTPAPNNGTLEVVGTLLRGRLAGLVDTGAKLRFTLGAFGISILFTSLFILFAPAQAKWLRALFTSTFSKVSTKTE